ncbi:golgin-45 [Sitodiplosis mosellana]|uniref:golgin-45 n=1 Tax=Sitodiplosis mosellana TaxID=263140 RepID=UPI0024442D4B|nr:golgin-45 [Sitodiplosis mosellana]
MDVNDFVNGRTRGDGMEFVESQSERANKISQASTTNPTHRSIDGSTSRIPGATTIYRFDDSQSNSVKLPAKIPQGKPFYLVPHLVNTKKSCSLKNKAPKFVPFEPYKAAVNPMVPDLQKRQRTSKKNNLDLNTLVSHVANIKTSELNSMNVENNAAKEAAATQQKLYEKQIAELKKERDSFGSELKFQVQVNSELKNLLVAAVGEDLQTRVNVLTEDKLQLARALLSSATEHSTHTEQIEYLANQSEVWRSKFLASSLMVEELARWKASLMQKNKLLLDSNKQMLETMSQLRTMQTSILRNLKFLAQLKSMNLPSSNVTDLTLECLNISEQLVLHSGRNVGMPDDSLDLTHLDTITESEKLAIDAIQASNQNLVSSDAAHKAVVDQAFPPTRASVETQTSINDINQ